jgi:hypothetical protein
MKTRMQEVMKNHGLTDKEMEHEFMRFNNMDDVKLRRRLNKITKLKKLKAFVLAASFFKDDEFVSLAYERMEDLGYL